MIKRKINRGHLHEMTERARMIIEDNPLAIATISDDHPNVAAASYARVVGEEIVLSVIHMKRTIQNIRNNPHVSLIVWNNDWAGYKIDGIAEYYDSGEWLDYVRGLPENKGEHCNGALVIHVERMQEII